MAKNEFDAELSITERVKSKTILEVEKTPVEAYIFPDVAKKIRDHLEANSKAEFMTKLTTHVHLPHEQTHENTIPTSTQYTGLGKNKLLLFLVKQQSNLEEGISRLFPSPFEICFSAQHCKIVVIINGQAEVNNTQNGNCRAFNVKCEF